MPLDTTGGSNRLQSRTLLRHWALLTGTGVHSLQSECTGCRFTLIGPEYCAKFLRLRVVKALHGMPARWLRENCLSVHPSVCLSVKRVGDDKTEERSQYLYNTKDHLA